MYAAVEGRGPFDRVGGSAAVIAGVANEAAPRSPSAGPLAPVIDALLSREPGTRPDATTAARLLTEAATAARTGARPLGDGWLAAEASTAERDAVSDADTDDPVGGSAHASEVSADEQRAAFLDPPVFGELSIPEWTGPADALEASLGSHSLDETPLVAAGQFGDVGLAGGVGLGAADAAVALGAVADAGIAMGAAGDAGIGFPAANADAAATAGAANAGAPAWAELAGIGSVSGPGEVTDALATAGLAGAGAASSASAAGPAWHSRVAGTAGVGGNATAPGPAGAAAGKFAGAAAGSGAGTAGLAGPQLGYGGDGNPVLWEPFKPTSGGSAAGDSSPGDSGATQGSGGSGTGGNGGGWFRNRGGPARPSSGRWRLMVAGAGIAAIVVAAVIGWGIYSGTQTPQALQGTTPSVTGTGGGGSAGPGSSGSARGGQHRPGTSPAAGGSGPTGSGGQSPGKGKPSSGPSGKPSASPSSSTSGSTSPSPSPTPSSTPTPSPSPSTSGPPPPILPPGYIWHHFTAAVMTSTAGFKIGTPSLWRQSVTGLIAHLNQPVHDFHMMVNLALWTYVKPLAQAQYLQAKDAKTYHAYKELSLGAVNFTTVGGFRVAPAAQLKFTWTKPSGVSYTELVILVTLQTKSGLQPYTLSVWAPSATFTSAGGVFHKALKTFRPMPAP